MQTKAFLYHERSCTVISGSSEREDLPTQHRSFDSKRFSRNVVHISLSHEASHEPTIEESDDDMTLTSLLRACLSSIIRSDLGYTYKKAYSLLDIHHRSTKEEEEEEKRVLNKMTTEINKPLDPYVAQGHADQLSLKEKVEDLVKFMNDIKYGMLTTKTSDSDLLTSRCMALAATVREI